MEGTVNRDDDDDDEDYWVTELVTRHPWCTMRIEFFEQILCKLINLKPVRKFKDMNISV